MIDMQKSVYVLAQVLPDEVIPLVVTGGHLLYLHSFVSKHLCSSPPTFLSTPDFILY